MSGGIKVAHILKKVACQNGSVLIGLGTVTGKNIRTVLTSLPKGFVRQLLTDSLYVNIHSSQFPGGEIRSQLRLETDWALKANLDGTQVIPSNTTTLANGLAVFNLSKEKKKLKYYIVTIQLSAKPTAVSLNVGAKGVTGNSVADLTTSISDNLIMGEVDPTSFIDDLLNGQIYINISTTENTLGEIRGQIGSAKGLHFDAMLDGSQSNTPTVTAKGVGSFYLNPSMDSLWYDVTTNGLSGAITACHFHFGTKGNTGGVAVGFGGGISGNKVRGIITGTILTNALINQLLAGEIYINVHTTLNPSGEIRGQVMPFAREAFTFKLDGTQEVPANSSSAEGTGIV